MDNMPQRITKTSLDQIPTMDEMAKPITILIEICLADCTN